MKSITDLAIQVVQHADWLGPSLAGGLADYLSQVKRGSTRGTFTGMLVHLFAAGFVGWMVGDFILAAGYGREFYSVSCGIGGLLGVRVAEVVLFVVNRHK